MNSFVISKCIDCGHSRKWPSVPDEVFCELMEDELLSEYDSSIPDKCPKLLRNKYRLATKDDIGKECYYSDISLEEAVNGDILLAGILIRVSKSHFYTITGTSWKYAAVEKEKYDGQC